MSAKERSSARMTSRIASLITDGLSHDGWPLSSRIASLITDGLSHGLPLSSAADGVRSSRSMQTDRNWKVATDRSVLPVAVGDANWKVGLGLPLIAYDCL